MRTVILGLIAFGLAVAVFLVWPRGSDEEPAGTTVPATSTSPAETTTTLTAGVTTTPDDSHVVETVEEAEEILRELWFGWFEGIYNQDEERIREVVATAQFLDAGIAAFNTLSFMRPPAPDAMEFDELEVLRATDDCTAVWSVSRADFLDAAEARSGVDILRFDRGHWRFASSWQLRNDLWEADCATQLLPLP
ncbi:MAG: hypothetical protein PVG83_00860 [Acidimicrobiia bacterium]|jgi:hypothetical protein